MIEHNLKFLRRSFKEWIPDDPFRQIGSLFLEPYAFKKFDANSKKKNPQVT